MLIKKTIRIFCSISSIKQSLKILQLNIPTNKSQIKKQYLILAKKYHPDSTSINTSNTSTSSTSAESKTKVIKKQLQQKFVNINKAYQYLRELTQQQINSNKQPDPNNPTSASSSTNNKPNQQQQRRRMTVQQMTRQQAYQYFNKKYYQEVMGSKNGDSLDDNTIQRKRLPLYKSVPELFVGFLLLAVMLGDWSYRIMKRKNAAQKLQAQQIQVQKQFAKLNQNQQLANSFKNMSYGGSRKKKVVQYIE